jgi:hypothetical protein
MPHSLRLVPPVADVALRNARRTANRERGRTELICECTRPGCSAGLPGLADDERGSTDCFIVDPHHFDRDGGSVVRAADRFFVVRVRNRAGDAR